MWSWLTNVGSGIINVMSGKSWNGDDASSIKKEAEEALASQKAEYESLVNQYKSSLTSANESKKTLTYVLIGVGVCAFAYFMFFAKGKGVRLR